MGTFTLLLVLVLITADVTAVKRVARKAKELSLIIAALWAWAADGETAADDDVVLEVVEAEDDVLAL